MAHQGQDTSETKSIFMAAPQGLGSLAALPPAPVSARTYPLTAGGVVRAFTNDAALPAARLSAHDPALRHAVVEGHHDPLAGRVLAGREADVAVGLLGGRDAHETRSLS